MLAPSDRKLRFPTLALDKVIFELGKWSDQEKPLVNFAPGQSSFNVWKALGEEPPSIPIERVLRYGDLSGSLKLRESISQELSKRSGVTIDPMQICITNGGTEAIMLALQLLMRNGDALVTSQTCYPGYRHLHHFFGASRFCIPLRSDFVVDLNAIQQLNPEKGQVLLVNSPCNPFGTVMTSEELLAISQLQVPIIFDEVYQPLGLDNVPVASALPFTDRHFVVGSFAKSLAVPGLRLGFLVSPPHFADEIVNIKALVSVSSSNAGQHVLEHLLQHWNGLENLHREYLQSHHDLFMDVCNGLGLELMRKPEAGLFATLKLPTDLGLDSSSVALELAAQHGIGVVPSTDFQEEGPAFLRLNFSVPREQIEPGLVRLKSALQSMA